MRRLLVFFLIAVAASTTAAVPVLASVQPDPSEPADTVVVAETAKVAVDNEFLDTERDLADCLNNSVELPGCGRAPTDEGGRGGGLQFVAFAILAAGIGFICWRVTKGIRARDAALASSNRVER
ncbi:MAG: hypothetical protein ABIW84_07140 [Ilumatobacteraceae bacterium]